MPADLLVTAVIVTLGVTLQTAVGFGMGLFCIPLLVLLGRSLPEAVAILIGASGLQTAMGSWALRSSVQWRLVLPVAGLMALCMPLGQIVMKLIVDEGQAFMKQAVGAMLLVVLIARALVQPVPRAQVAPGWGWLAGGLGGFLAGLVGMGGPPLVFFALAHTWDKDRYRAFLWPLFMLNNPVLVGLLAYQFGTGMLIEFAWGMAMLPCVWLGSTLGMGLSARWDMKQLQVGASVLLYTMAVTSIVSPML